MKSMNFAVFVLLVFGLFLSAAGCATHQGVRHQDIGDAGPRKTQEIASSSSGGIFGWIPTFGLVRSANPPRVPDSTGYHALQRGGVTGVTGTQDVHANRDLTAFQSGNINPLPEPPEIIPQKIEYHGN